MTDAGDAVGSQDRAAPLSGSTVALCDGYDVAMLDLDGVVYVGPDAVHGVPTALERARAAGMQLAFVTNNAARPPDVVAAHLTEIGVAADAAEVITSAQAAARYLSDRLPGGADVLVVGTTGLEVALRERGLVPVDHDSDTVAAVVQGYSPDTNWARLADAAVAIRRGLLWVATNADPTVPSPRGPLPGNGALVAALRTATDRRPVVTGKPDPTMHRETVLRTGARHPIVVGDRLDTDIEGANAVGCASLFVLSGVSTPADLLTAPPELRPTYLGADAGALLHAHPEPGRPDSGSRTCGGWRAEAQDGGISLVRAAAGGSADNPGADDPDADDPDADDPDADDLDALRAVCAAAWEAGTHRVRGGDDAASAVLDRLGLGG